MRKLTAVMVTAIAFAAPTASSVFAGDGTHIGTIVDSKTCTLLAKALTKQEPASESYCVGKEMYWRRAGAELMMVSSEW